MITDSLLKVHFWFKAYLDFIYSLFLFLFMVSFQCSRKGLCLYQQKVLYLDFLLGIEFQ